MKKISIKKELSEYNKFVNQIQRFKMKELWNNKYDEVWEDIDKKWH